MAPESDSSAPLAGGLPTQYVDVDPDETREWIDSLDALVDTSGNYRARYMMLSLLRRAAERNVGVPSLRSTDYINTISPEREPWFPGDEAVEREIRRMIRWNAAIMVHRAQRPGVSVGGHISTYASSATLYEVGFNHFFKGPDHPGGADQLFFQGHASPGMYARAFIEGRITESQMDGFRQELSHPGGGLPSYPHPRLMPSFWQFPTVSMGLGPLNAIYQARFNKYLQNRGLADTSQQKVYAFLGDGETDEVDAVGALSLARARGARQPRLRRQLQSAAPRWTGSRQRQDHPGTRVAVPRRRMERHQGGLGTSLGPTARGGPRWCAGQLMNNTHDGDFQTLQGRERSLHSRSLLRTRSATAKLVETWSDDEIWSLATRRPRLPQDVRRVRGRHEGQGAAHRHLGQDHQGLDAGIALRSEKLHAPDEEADGGGSEGVRDRLHIPIADSQLDEYLPPYYNPVRTIRDPVHARPTRDPRWFLPSRRTYRTSAASTPDSTYEVCNAARASSRWRQPWRSFDFCKDLIRDEGMGAHFVPIIPDEARTFGMDSLFPTLKIYSPHGQQYTRSTES